MYIQNPVLKGFNPDPSIVRKDGTYYIATSTFEWYPGVQIHQSTDLVNWELVTHPLADLSRLNIIGNPDSGGVWAPDLSYADGKFWLVYSDVKVVEGAFKDCTNYLITAEEITGPWSDPIKLNGLGFDASLFHDTDGHKYLVQMEWDHREYHHQFNGIKCTEYSVEEQRLLPETAKIIWKGTEVKLVEAPHLYKLFGQYYLFCAEGGTTYAHQEVVARSSELYGEYETQPEIFLTAYDDASNYLQKCGHGSLVDTPEGEWYFAHLTGRPWQDPHVSTRETRGWCTLGRETAIQKVEWTEDKWPVIVGGRQGSQFVEVNHEVIVQDNLLNNVRDEFDEEGLSIHFNTLRQPFSSEIGYLENSQLCLIGKGSFENLHECSLVARRWQHFEFTATTKVSYHPDTFQQMAGLTNYYNSKHWSMIHITWNEINGRVIEISENNAGRYQSYLKDQAIPVPESVEDVYFRTIVSTTNYRYQYSFDGIEWHDTGIVLDAKVLSDDYVNQSYGGFFTGAFVGMANIDYSGYDKVAKFDFFHYEEGLEK